MTEILNKDVEGVFTPETSTPKTTTKTTAKSTTKKVEPKEPVKLRAGQIDKGIEVEFRNNTNGSLVFTSNKTGETYILDEYGDVDYMTFEEILGLKNNSKRFLEEYWLTITDLPNGEYTIEQINDVLGISYLYEKDKANLTELDKFIHGNINTFKEVYVTLPETTKKNMIGRARKLYFSGELKGFELVKFLTDITGDRELFLV